MDVRKTIAELTSQLSEVNYESDDDNLLLKDSGNEDLKTVGETDFAIESSKLRKVNASIDLPQQTYSGKKTTRKKTFPFSDVSDNERVEDTYSSCENSSIYESPAESDASDEEIDSDKAYSSDEDKELTESPISKRNAVTVDIYSAKSKNIPSDVQKGTAIRNQLRIWESLLECRIKLQKALVASNNLPPKEELINVKMKLDSENQSKWNKIKRSLLVTLEKMVTIQKELLKQNNELNKTKNKSFSEMDVEIQSDESEIEDDLAEGEDIEEEPQNKKRKLNDFETLIKENHKKFIPIRNASIQKWNDKTKVSSGKMASSNFSAFDQSTLKQIEQVMADRTRLINRTRVKRNEGQSSNINDQNGLKDVQETNLDPEIFDDTDFYHKLLRDYIERKSADVTNSSNTERQMIELQKLRSKMKKNVDTKSTKGRKLRYVILPKLVNFMAPDPYNTWTDQAENDLYNSLFGNIKVL